MKRNEVPVELTWDLSLIYPTEEDMLADMAAAEKEAEMIVSTWKGALTSPEAVNACLDAMMKMEEKLGLCGNYAELAASVDFYDNHLQELDASVNARFARIMSEISFIDSEIAECDESVIREAISRTTTNKGYLEDVLRNKPHRLSAETEKLLASLGQVFQGPYNTYNMIKLADMVFDPFTVNGKEYPLSYSAFEDDYEYTADTDVRRAAYHAFSAKLRQYQNGTASAYNTYVTNDKVMADARGFNSVFDSLLFEQKVTREMYDRQIDLITEKLAPAMQKYAKLIQKLHGLDRVTFADLKLPLYPDYDPKISPAQARDYCVNALSILGEDYAGMVREAFEKRWIDFAKNDGKSTGGFCASPYGKGSFILLSWNDRMSDLMTVAHELGHAGHFKACNAAQSIYDTNVSSYLVESPSTMNELLMAHYLLSTSDDPRFRKWVLSSMISNTYFHNFVTHLREAWFQREVYRIIEAGGSVSADTLNELFHKNLTLFWGDAVEIDADADLTWMRQPHYYMGLYSYTYSAGLTLATQVYKRILKEGQPAVDDWKAMLAAGSTKDPIGLGKLAGIDLTTDEALLDTIDFISSIIDELCQ